MTKKQLIALADTIINSAPKDRTADGAFSRSAILELADFCEAQNPNFNRERWLDYIDGKCGQNGGKVKKQFSTPKHIKTINDLETYKEAGIRAAKANKNRDFALAKFHNNWFSRSVNMEQPSMREKIREVFRNAYHEEYEAN